MTFLDEIGDSVNQFFANYLAQSSGTGAGYADIKQGFGKSSSSLPYTDQQLAGSPNGARNGPPSSPYIILEQIFANGTLSNRFVFINPRIETFDFDDLSMEENNGSMVTITFTYDAILPYTIPQSTLYSWGNTDLLAGGGTSGPSNGFSMNGIIGGAISNGLGLIIGGAATVPNTLGTLGVATAGLSLINGIPRSIGAVGGNTVASPIIPNGYSNTTSYLSASTSVLSRNLSTSLTTVSSGSNLSFGGAPPSSPLNSGLTPTLISQSQGNAVFNSPTASPFTPSQQSALNNITLE
jgi:hypothetical protein